MLGVLLKFVVDVALNIVPISLPFFGEFPYEMLMWIGMDAYDLVAWLLVASVARWIWGWLWVGIGGAEGAGGGVSGVGGVLKHFFQISMPIRKRTKAMPIIAAGNVKVQWASAGLIWSSSLNNSLASNSHCTWSGVPKRPGGCPRCWPCQRVPPTRRSSPWSSSGSQWFPIRLLRSCDP